MKPLFTMMLCVLLNSYNYAQPISGQNNSQTEQATTTFDQNSYFTVGMLSITLKYPDHLHLDNFNQKGFMIGNKKNSKNIDEINFSDHLVFSINIGSENSFGFALNENTLNYNVDGVNTIDTVKHYTGFANLVSYNLNAELINNIPVVNRKIIAGVAVTFFNIGGNFTYMTGGRYDKRVIGALDVLPFYMQIYCKLALKNASIGVGLLYNPYSFAEYRFGPKEFMDEYSGIKLNSSMYNKFIVQAYINLN